MALNGGSMKKNILLVGPVLPRSGYGEQARFALRSLRSQPDLFDVYIKPLTWGETSWLIEDTPERRWIDETIEKTIGYIQQGGKFDISLQVTIPNEFENLAAKNIGYTAGIETTIAAPEWINSCNQMDSVIVVSNHSKNVLESSKFEGVDDKTNERIFLENTTSINVVNYPVKTFDNLPKLNLELDTEFNFLTVAQMGHRKNLNTTIKCFIEEFHDENVGLVVKTNLAKNSLIDRNTCKANIKSVIDSLNVENRKCKVYLLHGNMTDEEIHALYVDENINAMVAIPHGEGYGLPIFEAAYSGLPVISVGWSGQCDFLYDKQMPPKPHFYEVAFDIRPVPQEALWAGVIVEQSGWAYAREESTKQQMRQCFDDIKNNNEDSYALKSCERAAQLNKVFSKEKMYGDFVNLVTDAKKLQDVQEEVEDLLNDLL